MQTIPMKKNKKEVKAITRSKLLHWSQTFYPWGLRSQETSPSTSREKKKSEVYIYTPCYT